MPENRTLYFAYGSNMDIHQMAYRCPDASVVCTVRLDDYRLAYRGSGFATILPEKGSHVDGVLWNISTEDEKHLDHYEGYPRHYGKESITVKADDGTPIQAMVYTMMPPMRDIPAMPAQSYFNTITRGRMQNGLPFVPAVDEVNRAYREVCAAREATEVPTQPPPVKGKRNKSR